MWHGRDQHDWSDRTNILDILIRYNFVHFPHYEIFLNIYIFVYVSLMIGNNF